MRPTDLRKLIKAEPFGAIRLGLSDGRSVVVRHPDQVVIAERHVLIGLARLETSPPLRTPKSGDAIAKGWLIVNLLHISTVEPNGTDGTRKKKRRT
jgi:hypothetical protein